MKYFNAVSFIFFAASLYSADQIATSLYVTNFTENTIYRVDPTTGQSTLITQTPVGLPGNPGLVGIQLLNENTAYTIGYLDGQMYSVNLSTGASSKLTTTSIGSGATSSFALANNTTAYAANGNDNRLYKVDLVQGTSVPITGPPAGMSTLNYVVLRNDTAYISDYSTPKIWAVDVNSGLVTSLITPSLGTNIGNGGISLLDNIAYGTETTFNLNNNSIYAIDLASGAATRLVSIPGHFILGEIIAVNDNLAYTTDATNNYIYVVDLQTGAYSILTQVPGSPGLNAGIFGITAFLQPSPRVHIAGLTANLLTVANYLNANAPSSTLQLFNPLTGSTLTQALTATNPARLGFATFASQNGYLATAQIVTDHLNQKRFSHPKRGNPNVASLDLPQEELLVDASTRAQWPKKTRGCNSRPKSTCPQNGWFTGWMTPFGEYAHEKSQQQTPAFSANLGGVLLGMDYNFASGYVIGFGGAYAFTHIHEDQSMGNANVNQILWGAYSTIREKDWYLNLAMWTGYYHTHNNRKISFPGFQKTAKSSTHGWQLAPHAEVGYDGFSTHFCHVEWLGVNPFALVDWVSNWERGFSEHGGGPLDMHQTGKFSSLVRGETGLRVHETLRCDWGDLIFEEKGSYAYQKMFGTGSVTATLLGSPGSFTVTTLTTAQNLGVFEFSMLFNPISESLPYFDLRYQGEFGSKYQSHQGIVEIGKDF